MRDPRLALRAQRLRRLVGSCAIVEEAVDAGAGAADVGSEGTKLAEPLRERRAREIVRRQQGEISSTADGCERTAKRFAALAIAVGAVPDVEGAVDVSGRRLDGVRGKQKDDRVVARQVEGARLEPSPPPSCAPLERKNGTSAPIVAARAARSDGPSGSGSSSFARRRATAASELPPPRPAATGIAFSISTLQAGSIPARCGKRGQGCRDDGVVEPGHRQARAGRHADAVARAQPVARRSRPRACRPRAAARRRARG